MPGVRDLPKMELYMSNSIDELNLKAELPSDKIKSKQPKVLITTAVKLFTQAMDFFEKGDSEASYVNFMKYLNLVSLIRKTPDYRKDEKFFNQLLGTKNVASAIENAEILQEELVRRYSDRAEEASVREKLAMLDLQEQEANQVKEKEDKEKLQKKREDEEKGKIPPLPDNVMSSWNLDAIIKQKSTSFVIFDVRPSEEFKESHIKHPSCFSVPEEILRPGLSAAALCRLLPMETKAIGWPKRLMADVIIIVDWFGERAPGSAVFTLEEIFRKWDPGVKYNGTTKLLSGGYEEWLARFPLQTTNPRASAAVRPSIMSTLMSPDLVPDIEYPDLDAQAETNPPTATNGVEEFQARQPTVNRTTKPVLEVRQPSVEYSPFLPADSTKFVPQEPPVVVPMPNIPQVDRKLKKEALVKYLQAEEELVERSKDRLNKEQEWDRIRSQKESSLNSELTAQLQEREEQLINVLRQMENDNKQQEAEIARLRLEVDRYEKREEDSKSNSIEEAVSRTEEQFIQTRIQESEQKRQAMYKEVERLRLLRKQQQTQRAQEQQLIEKERQFKEQQELERIKAAQLKEAEAQQRKMKSEEEARQRNLKNQQETIRKNNINVEKLKNEATSSPFGFGSKMNRSHSTPDLAQALQNELPETPTIVNRVPKVERTLKPLTPNRTRLIPRHDLSNKNRNFNPVYGSIGRGLTGLKNLGNTCYMNSIIQCINSCSLLTGFFVDGSYRNYVNASNLATRGEITDEVSSTLKALWSGTYRSISCKDLKNAVGRYYSSFRGYEQQDSHEFLTVLIDWLHEELNEIRVKVPLKEQNNSNIPDEKAAILSWNDYTSSNKSIIVKLFGGQERSCLRCSACGKESVTFGPFFNLSLPIPPSKSQCNIMECFQLYTKTEQIDDWPCPSCKNKRGNKKTMDIWKLPPVLVVHLKRFYNDGLWRKRLTMIDFNPNDLDMDNVVKSKQPGHTRFKLYAVSNHYGTMDAGHYTAYCKNPAYDKWFKFDDQDVMEVNATQVCSAAAYILFYSAIDYEAPPLIQD